MLSLWYICFLYIFYESFLFLPVLFSASSCHANQQHRFMLLAIHTYFHLWMRSKYPKKKQALDDTGCIQTDCYCCLWCSSFSLLIVLLSHPWPSQSPEVPQHLGLNNWTVSVQFYGVSLPLKKSLAKIVPIHFSWLPGCPLDTKNTRKLCGALAFISSGKW